MSKWSADYANDPSNDYDLVIEILYDNTDVAVISKGKEGLEIKWYAHKEDLIIPINWLTDILIKANSNLK